MTKANPNPTTSLSRREAVNLIVGAGVSAYGLAKSAACSEATADEGDPIFAAIQRHKDLYAAFEAALHARNEREEVLLAEKHAWSWNVNERVRPNDPNLDSEYLALDIRADELSDQHASASRALLDVAPTTMLGVAAILRYAYEVVVAGGNNWDGYFDPPERDDGLWSLEDWNSELHRRLADVITDIATRSTSSEARDA
jgi:hypothetical protein